MGALGTRIRQVLEEKGISQAQLARLVGVKQQTISYICGADSPATASRYATKIAQALGVNPAWLQSGEGDQHDPVVRIEMNGIEMSVRQVPLLAGGEAAAFAEGGEPKQGKTLMTDAEISTRAFAMEIEGESMAPAFRSGDRVVIDTKVMPEPGDFVAAKAQGLLTFRKYRARGNELFELVPLNEDWPVLRSDTCDIKILGVMAEHRSYRRRK